MKKNVFQAIIRNSNLRSLKNRKFSVGRELPPQSQKPKEEFPGQEGPKMEGEVVEPSKETQKERVKFPN